MPRHPPIALKTLDRSHCQYPPRDLEEIVASTKSRRIFASARSQRDRRPTRSRRDRRFSQILCRIRLDGIGTKRPASRDRFEGAVRQTHHMREIERLPRQITPLAGYEVRTNLLFTMSYRTGGEPRSSPQTLKTNDFATGFHLYSTPFLPEKKRQSCGLRSDNPVDCAEMVEPDGIEPTTSCLQSRRSPS